MSPYEVAFLFGHADSRKVERIYSALRAEDGLAPTGFCRPAFRSPALLPYGRPHFRPEASRARGVVWVEVDLASSSLVGAGS